MPFRNCPNCGVLYHVLEPDHEFRVEWLDSGLCLNCWNGGMARDHERSPAPNANACGEDGSERFMT